MSYQKQNILRATRVAIASAAAVVVLSACGGTEQDPGSTAPGITASNISPEPAFLSRSCDGQASPHLFCPNSNGG